MASVGEILFQALGADPWKQDAACRGAGPDKFYLDELDDDFEEKQALAFSLCEECPVKVQCEEYAEDRNEEFGIWAGSNREML